MAFFASFIKRQFLTEPPVPSIPFAGRIVIVTGSNVGLGLEACRQLVTLGASQVILACRNTEKGEAAAKDIQTTTSCAANTLQVWQLDMSSSASILAFASRVKADLPRLDALIANAGIGTREFRLTEGHVEETIQTNVIGLSLLTCLLLPKLRETAVQSSTDTHCTVTASELYEVAKFKESTASDGEIFATLNDKSKSNMIDRYNVSKLLEVFLVKQLAAMLPIETNKVIINCVAPGLCNSALHREHDGPAVRVMLKILARPSAVGARTLVYGASAGVKSHGQYLPDCKITATAGLTKGEKGTELQSRVWKELEQLLETIQPGVTTLA